MKFRLTAVLALCVLLSWSLTGCEARANESITKKEDSYCVKPEIVAQLDVQESEQVIRVFHASPWYNFGEDYLGIDALVKQKEEAGTVGYYVFSKDALKRIYRKGKDIEELEEHDVSQSRLSPKAIREVLSHRAIRMVDENIQVINEWIIGSEYFASDGQTVMGEGTAIYYETDIGDYVYYCGGGNSEHIMPVDVFVNCMRAIDDYVSNIFGNWGGYYPSAYAVDLAGNQDRYDIHSEKFRLGPDPVMIWLVAGACVLAVGTVAAILLLRRKKKA